MKQKEWLILFTSLLGLVGCGNAGRPDINSTGNSDIVTSETVTSEGSFDTTVEESKSAVVYFSCTGTTARIASMIASSLEVSAEEIVPKVAYTSADLNYSDSNCRANREQNDTSSRPEIATSFSFDGVDSLYIGYPIWWGKLPKIIYTFFDTYDFTNVRIYPFCTSGSTGISTSVSEIKTLEPNAEVEEGRRFASSSAQTEIDEWLKTCRNA